ncbi:MAG: hypothetical protein ACRD9S_04880 [Pyrinomonadaceae bacterium]
MIIEKEKIVHHDIDPISFERPSRAYWYSKRWSRELPESVRLSLEGLRAMNRSLEPEAVEHASGAVLERLCEVADAVVHITPLRTHKRQVKGFIAYSDNIWDRALEARSISRTRTHTQPIVLSRDRTPTAKDVLRDLDSMLEEQVDDPDFQHRPTKYAHELAHQIIESSYTHDIGVPPVPAIAPDGDGGLVVEWKTGNRIVRLIICADQGGKSYIYSREPHRSLVERSVSGLVLAQQLSRIFV